MIIFLSSLGGFFNYVEVIVVVLDFSVFFVEDEIWDEYNDLFGEDIFRFFVIGGKVWLKLFCLEVIKWIELVLELFIFSFLFLFSLV